MVLMIKLVSSIFILFFGVLAICFQPFETIPNPNLKKRSEFREELARSQLNLTTYATNRYGDFGPVALSRLERLSKDFRPLIVVPGIMLEIDNFERFVKERQLGNTDPWKVVELFSDFLSREIVYRGLLLDENEFKTIQAAGIQSNSLRAGHKLGAYSDFSFAIELLRRVKKNRITIDPDLPDRTVSISAFPEISRIVAMGLADLSNIGKKDLYIFKIEIPKLENLTIARRNADLCNYPARNSETLRGYIGDAKTIRIKLCEAGFFPKETETFAEYLIEPAEIKEFEKIELTKDNILKSERSLYNILHKQTCDELEALREIINAEQYARIKEGC